MISISKYEVLQEKINNQPALGQQRLKVMLRFLQDGQVDQSELAKILAHDYKGRSKEQIELYNILVGLVIDLYIKNNGQDNFISLYSELKEENSNEQIVPTKVEEFENSTIIAPQHTERTPKAVSPRKKIALSSYKLKGKEKAVETSTTPFNRTLTSEEATEVKEVSNEPKPYISSNVTQVLDESVDGYEEENDVLEQTTFNTVVEDEPYDKEEFEGEKEVKGQKRGGVLKYLVVGIPTVIAVGGLVFWQVTTNNTNKSIAEQQAVKILEEAPKASGKGEGLSSSEYDSNIKILTQGIDSVRQNDKTGLSGYLVVDDKKYIIQKYDQSNGSLTVFDTNGEKTVFDKDWVQKLIERSKEGKTKLPESSSTTEGGN